MEVIERLASAAQNTNGTLTFRGDKLFGKLMIIVNKCQDISVSDEDELTNLENSSPSLIKQIDQYFTSGPEIILLPALEWDYNIRPDFNEEGIYKALSRILKNNSND